MLRFLTAGESHGSALLAILEGMPAGLKIDARFIDKELKRRQSGYGRGRRMQIEKDRVQIVCGLKGAYTLAGPIGVIIKNKDFSIEDSPSITSPRPGHADLAGVLKYGFKDVRDVLERASARETAARVAIGAICKLFLAEFDMSINSKVQMIGAKTQRTAMKKIIDEARIKGDTVGGVFEITANGVPAGLGSYVHWDRRLNARIAGNIMSIPGVKAVEFGLGLGYAKSFGSQVHDAIYYSAKKGFWRKTNNAGGIEGGVSNGQPLVIRACMKPIATLARPLDSVNILTKRPHPAAVQRADVCAVEAAAVIAEGALAFVLCDSFLEKFGSDALSDIRENFKNYLKRISEK